MSCSARALKLLGNKTDIRILYEQLHKMCARATPVQMMNYKHSLLLFKLYNDTKQTDDWMDLNWNQSFNNRSTKVRQFDVSSKKIGKNILTNRLTTLMNNQIEYDWLNKSWNSYKLICKNLLLKWRTYKRLIDITFIKIILRRQLFLDCKCSQSLDCLS